MLLICLRLLSRMDDGSR